jgi:hypothetical protein
MMTGFRTLVAPVSRGRGAGAAPPPTHALHRARLARLRRAVSPTKARLEAMRAIGQARANDFRPTELEEERPCQT